MEYVIAKCKRNLTIEKCRFFKGTTYEVLQQDEEKGNFKLVGQLSCVAWVTKEEMQKHFNLIEV